MSVPLQGMSARFCRAKSKPGKDAGSVHARRAWARPRTPHGAALQPAETGVHSLNGHLIHGAAAEAAEAEHDEEGDPAGRAERGEPGLHVWHVWHERAA